MPEIQVPNSVSFHTARNFLEGSDFFTIANGTAVLSLHPKFFHLEPYALAMIAAWATWCRRQGLEISVESLGPKADFAWRMHLFDFLGVEYDPGRREREEAGRFMPLKQVRTGAEIKGVIGDVSTLLHMADSPESLAAVQYCVSELLRNVIEHSGSPDGAFVCAQNFHEASPPRVTIAVADCGIGIREHLQQVYREAEESDAAALILAMQPGITGARPGMYGTPDNAGAGLFITRSIAKGSGGYFLAVSGLSAYRLRRARTAEEQTELPLDPRSDRHDQWDLPHPWQGTVVSMEIRTDQIEDFEGYFSWIRRMVPERKGVSDRLRFTE